MIIVNWRAIKQKWVWGLVLVGLLLCGNSLWIHAKAVLAQTLIANAWQKTLEEGKPHKPWYWADSWPVARMRVPATGEDLYVLAGAHGTALAFGPGHMDGTALPGQAGTSVIGGHRDTHFNFLQKLEAGDWVLVQQPNARWQSYQIQARRVADIRHGELRLPLQGDWLYLVTCYPFSDWQPGGSERYIVEAVKIDPNARHAEHKKEAQALSMAFLSRHTTQHQLYQGRGPRAEHWQGNEYTQLLDARLASAHF